MHSRFARTQLSGNALRWPRGIVGGYYKVRRDCIECGNLFWGAARAKFCSSSCRCRAWRSRRVVKAKPADLAAYCEAIMQRPDTGSDTYSKLLPLLFRAAGAELRRRGWDPIELLLGIPDEPVAREDADANGVVPVRKWLFPPEQELKEIERRIVARHGEGRTIGWHVKRRNVLLAAIAARKAAPPGAPAPTGARG